MGVFKRCSITLVFFFSNNLNQEEIPYNDKKDRLNLNLADICGSFFLVLLLLANTRRDLLEESPLRLHSYFSILPELVMLLFVCLGFFFFWSCFVCQKYIFLYCLHFPWSHSPYGTLWYLMRIFLRTWNFKVFRENCGKKKVVLFPAFVLKGHLTNQQVMWACMM